MTTIEALAHDLVGGLQSREEVRDVAESGVTDTFFGDWSTAAGIVDSPELRAAMQADARERIAAAEAAG